MPQKKSDWKVLSSVCRRAVSHSLPDRCVAIACGDDFGNLGG